MKIRDDAEERSKAIQEAIDRFKRRGLEVPEFLTGLAKGKGSDAPVVEAKPDPEPVPAPDPQPEVEVAVEAAPAVEADTAQADPEPEPTQEVRPAHPGRRRQSGK